MTDFARVPEGFGELLRRERRAAGLTQEELAEKSGLSVRALGDLERGRIARPRRRTVRRIADALNLPGPEHKAVEAPPSLSPAQLPADVADFTGRQREAEELAALLGAADYALGAVVVLVVAGPAGIGKSALVVHGAHRVAPRFPDGQLYLNLRGSGAQPMTPGDALARFLRDLGDDPAGLPADATERANRYRSLLVGRRVLVVLDDARDAAQVRQLLPGTVGCSVLVTTRRSMPDLESARLIDLDTLNDTDALALFARIVGPIRATAEPGACHDAVTACGGLPLAIRIAAARLAARPSWSIAYLAARLRDERKRLDELVAGDLAVRASFMVSYTNLRGPSGGASDAVDRAFRLLALARGPDVSLPAAAALLGVPRDQAQGALELLVDHHLLRSYQPGRYRFHDLLRVYAEERVEAEEDAAARAEAARRMLSWYLQTAAAACRLVNPHRTHIDPGPAGPGMDVLSFGNYAEALAWLDAEHANLLTAVDQASCQGEHEIGWKLSHTLWDLGSAVDVAR